MAKTTPKCARCGAEMGKLSGIPACPSCGPSSRWDDRYDAPTDYVPGGSRRRPTPDSDGPEDWPAGDSLGELDVAHLEDE